MKYLTINEEDEKWGSFITTVGFQIIKPFASFPPAGHPKEYNYNPKHGRILQDYGMIYFTEGEGYFSSNHIKRHKLKEGSLIFIFPNEWHSYEPVPDIGWKVYWMHFKGYYPDMLIKNNFFTAEEPVFEIGLNETLIELYNQAIYYAEQEKTGCQQMLSGVCTHILSTIQYQKKNKPFNENETAIKINKAKSLMRERFDEVVNIESIARECNMGYSWFRKMFKIYTGLTPAQYMFQLKLHRAKTFLSSSNMSIKEIAYELNFDNPNYFSSFFRQKTGFSPEQFRNSVLPKK